MLDILTMKQNNYLRSEFTVSPDYDAIAIKAFGLNEIPKEVLLKFCIDQFIDQCGISFGLRGFYAELSKSVYFNNKKYFASIGYDKFQKFIQDHYPNMKDYSDYDYMWPYPDEVYEMYLSELDTQTQEIFNQYLSILLLECFQMYMNTEFGNRDDDQNYIINI